MYEFNAAALEWTIALAEQCAGRDPQTAAQRVARATTMVLWAVAFSAALLLLAVPALALSEFPSRAADSCPVNEQRRTHRLRFVDFEVPANWKVVERGDDVWAGPPEGGCGLGVTLTSADIGRFAHDPHMADRLYLAANPGFTLSGRAFDLMIGDQVPGKRMTLTFNNRGVVGQVETIVAVGGNQTFSAGFLVMDGSQYRNYERLADHVLNSVRVKSAVLNPDGALAALPPQVVDVQSVRRFQNSHLSFQYPGSWSKKSEGRDPEADGFQLVQFASSDGAEVLQVRYRTISPDQHFTDLSWQLTQTAARLFGRFYPDPSFPKETFAVGPVRTDWLRNDMAGGSMALIASEIRALPNYAHVAYAYDRNRIRAGDVRDLAARSLVLNSFRFSAPPTLIGEWVRQGEGLNLHGDQTFERYEIRSQESKPTVEQGTWEVVGNRLILRGTDRSGSREQTCTVFLRGESLTFCEPEFSRR